MLTQDDFEQFEKIVDKKLDQKLNPVLGELNTLKTKTEDLDKTLEKSTKRTERRLKKIQNTLDTYIRVSDDTIQETRKRVDRIEDHLKLPAV